MRRKQITSIVLSLVLASSAFCSPFAQVPAYAAEEAAEAVEAAEAENAAKAAEAAEDAETAEAAGVTEETAVEDVNTAVSGEAVNDEAETGISGEEAGDAEAEVNDEENDEGVPQDDQQNADTSENTEEAIEEAVSIQDETYSEPKDGNAGDSIFEGTVSVTTKSQEATPEADDGKSSEDLFAEYVDRSFGVRNGQAGQAPSGRKRAPKSAASSLTGIERAVYDEIAAYLPAIAAGERASTEFEIDVDDLGLEKTFWTAGELGIPTIFAVDESGNMIIDDEGNATISDEAIEAIDEITSYDLLKVIHALLADHPYQLYWYEKTQETTSTGCEITAFYDDTVEDYLIGIDGCFTISLPVADEYSAGEYMVDTSIGQAVRTSVENANDIVDEHSGENDIEKLCSYRDEICSLVSYNYDAADGGVSYGNPWQMIWVFDGDPDTNVVCEGYSKAFQYLCDQSDFSDGNICAYSVSGTMTGGTGAGPHMWNIVTLDDRYHYLADITNSDSGTSGEDGELFLAPYTSGSVQDGYTFTCGDGTDIHYAYDEDILSIFSTDDLTIAAYAYGKAPLEITSQPQDVSAEAGETVVLHVEANKSGVTYQWQWKTDSTNWKNCTSGGYNRDTFSFTMKDTLSGRYYRCVVRSADETVRSEAARISLPPLEITAQPQDVNAEAGETVVLHVEANKSNVTYQWQWSSNGTTWKNCSSGGYNTDTFSFTMKATLSGRLYRCKVTGGEETLISEAAQITLLTVPLEITAQPQDVNAEAGETVVLHVEANKSDVTYQWQWKTDSTNWKNCTSGGYNRDTFSFTMKATLAGRLYRCKVTGNEETLTSKAARIGLPPLEITVQPQDVSADAGEDVVLHVETNKSNAAYQWQWSSNGTTWKNCSSAGYNTDTFTFKMKETLNNRLYRCRVTLETESAVSDHARITYEEKVVYRGQCGDNATWTVDPSTETLTINGTGDMWDYDIIIPWADYKSDFSKVIVNEGITRLGNRVFCECDNITSIELPDGLTEVGEFAFTGCSALEEIAIPSDVATIGDCAFQECGSLESITIPENVTLINRNTFCYCYNLKNITIPNGVTGISQQAFYYCTSLKNICIPDSVRYIGLSAFDGCGSLTEIDIPANVERIDDRAFDDCHALTDINVSPDNSLFKSVDGILYDKAATTLIRCPVGRTKTDVIVPDSVTRICYRAFGGCKHIVNVNIPDGVERIESETFYYCENLSGIVVLPDSVTAIDDYAFWGTGITSIRFSSALTTIGPDAFGMCNDLETCIYSGTTEQWQSIEFGYNNNCLRSSAHIICVNGEITPSMLWDITDGVLTLRGEGATDTFYWAHGDNGSTAPWSDRRNEITKVVIGEGITEISGAAFAFCENLTEVVLPSTLKILGNTVFDNCWSLEEITIPEGVESIGKCTFWTCMKLKTVRIPDTVTCIGEFAFSDCPLVDIYFSGTTGQWHRIDGLQSASIYENAQLHFGTATQFYGDLGYDLVNGECVITSYKGDRPNVIVPDEIEGCPVTEVNISPINPDGTRNEAVFGIISIDLPSSVKRLSEGAFKDWYALKVITGLDAVEYVGDYCFSGSGVESLEFTEELSWAGLYAFDANDLRSITIPDTLRWIDLGSGAFYGKSPFLNHEKLETIQLIRTGDTPTLTMDGPALYTADMVNLVCYPCKNPLRTYRIPDGVQLFYPRAFDIRDQNSTDGLYEIYIPSSVTGLLDAFYEIYTVMPDGTIDRVALPRLVVEEWSEAHNYCLNGDIHFYWRLAGADE